MDEHTHPFEAKALIIAGDMHITCGDTKKHFEVGDVFHLQAGEPHFEQYGLHGVQYLAGRK